MGSGNATVDQNGTAPQNPARGVFEGIIDRLFPDDPGGMLLDISAFVLIVAFGVFLGWSFRRSQIRVSKGPPTAGRLLFGRLVQTVTVLTVFIVALRAVYEIDVFGALAAVGLVSLALGFGLQNTVANMAAGVGLTIDRPFQVGDRIRVEETWGDVLSIGLRSTRIVTTGGEHVVIPNAVLDTQAVWNYTHAGHDRLRVEVPIEITYGSSLPLAENLALRAARRVDTVLPYPDPEVVYMDFAPDGVRFELRFWVRHAKDRNRTRNRVMTSVKESFDEGGVQFPFPQRTVSYLKDIPDPEPTPPHLEGEAGQRPVVLVVDTGMPDRQFAHRVAELGDRLEARLVILHVRPLSMALDADRSIAGVNVYLEEARKWHVPASARTEAGQVQDVLARICKEVGARLVVVDSRRRARILGRRSSGPIVEPPLIALSLSRPPSEDAWAIWRKRLYPEEEEAEEEADTGDEPEAADTSQEGAKKDGPKEGAS